MDTGDIDSKRGNEIKGGHPAQHGEPPLPCNTEGSATSED